MPEASKTADNIRLWFRTCPAILHSNRFTVDYLDSNPTEYAIYMSPSQLSNKIDVLGNVIFNTIQELNFLFASRAPYSRDVMTNLQNLGFFDEVIQWMCYQNEKKNFPEIEEGSPISLMPSTTQFLFESGADSGRYQIQCKMIYRREKKDG